MFGFFGMRRMKASKPKKKPKNNWFERLSLDQNKQLCKAAKLRHGGTKKELIDRLLENEQTYKFGIEGKYIGLNVEQIKQLCRQRNLQVSGQKFDLVLRILHCDNESTPAGATLKRAATETVSEVDASTGQVVEKQVVKKRKKAAPSASRAYTRVQKKIEAVRQKKYQSHWGSKTHSSEVYSLVGDILDDEALPNLTKDPRLCLDIAKAAVTSLTENFDTMERPGYDDDGALSTIDSSLWTIAEELKPLLSEEEREEFAAWIEEWDNTGEPYGLNMDTDLQKTVAFLRGDSGEDDEEETDERKPAAIPTKPVGVDGSAKTKEEQTEESKPASLPTKPVDIDRSEKKTDDLKPAAMSAKPIEEEQVKSHSNNLNKENIENEATASA